MRNTLPTSGARRNENGIWTMQWDPGYAKRNNRVVYFDSFGNLQPPKELCDISETVLRRWSTIAHPIRRIKTSADRYACSFYERSMRL